MYTLCLEVLLLISVVWLVLHRKKDRIKLTPEQKADLLDKWNPEPLINEVATTLIPSPRVVTGRAGKRLTVDGHDCLNMATHNYLGLVEDKEIEESAINCLRKYGVGRLILKPSVNGLIVKYFKLQDHVVHEDFTAHLMFIWNWKFV